MVRLADAVVVGRDRRVWAPDGSGAPVDAAGARLAPGTAVVVGPAGADDDQQRAALRALADLVSAGGAIAAGAGVALTPGFRSGRLDGGRGDRRDAILAALPVLGVDGLDRLGPRAAVLVALFGPNATKRVGARAGDAVREGRWGALRPATCSAPNSSNASSTCRNRSASTRAASVRPPRWPVTCATCWPTCRPRAG
jgi:hypothetical protein